ADGQSLTRELRLGLRDLGYSEGQTFAFQLRSADGDAARLPHLATELVISRCPSRAFFDLLTSKPSIRYHLQKTLGVEADRRRIAGIRLSDHASVRRAARAICLCVRLLVQQGHLTHLQVSRVAGLNDTWSAWRLHRLFADVAFLCQTELEHPGVFDWSA